MKYDFDLEDHSKKRKEIFLRVLLCALEIGVVLFVAYAITHFGLEKMTVSGKYMSPTLKDGDEILINKMCYRLQTPIFKASGPLNLQILAIRPQPMILHSRATITNPIENSTNSPFKWSKLVLSPILAKKIGPKII